MTISRATRRGLCALAVFAVAIGSAPAFRALGGSNATLLWKLSWAGLCFLGLAVAYRMGPSEALRELGLTGSPGIGLSVGVVTSLPMLAVLAVSFPWSAELAVAPILSTGVLAPITEELLFRGYLFLQLYRRAGWSFASAVITTAALFGLAHAGALAGAGKAVSLAGEVGMIAAGGAFYAWLLVRWQQNLWVAIAVHAFMNLSCELCGCDERPGTWAIHLGRLLAVGTAVGLTMACQGRPARAAGRPPAG